MQGHMRSKDDINLYRKYTTFKDFHFEKSQCLKIYDTKHILDPYHEDRGKMLFEIHIWRSRYEVVRVMIKYVFMLTFDIIIVL